MRRLGHVQRDVLALLRERGEWHPLCGWDWTTTSETRRILDSLVRAGYARRVDVEIKRSMRHIGGSAHYIEERTVYRPLRGKVA